MRLQKWLTVWYSLLFQKWGDARFALILTILNLNLVIVQTNLAREFDRRHDSGVTTLKTDKIESTVSIEANDRKS